MNQLTQLLVGRPLVIRLANDRAWNCLACFSKANMEMTFNKASLGNECFEDGLSEKVLELYIQEMGHYYSGDHLSSEYHDGLCTLGAKIPKLAINNQKLFSQF